MLGDRNLGERTGPARGNTAADAYGALVVVDRDVGVGLEDAQLALAFQRHPARRHVGDAAVGEPQARVRDVDRRREDRHADALDRHDVGRHEALNHVEVVDHEIANDVDIGATIDERREPVALEKARPCDDVARGAERRVEALEMPDL